jgi:regulatory protein
VDASERRATVTERFAAGAMTADEALDLTREAALRVLDIAPKSRRDLEASLARKGYPSDVVERVLDRLTEVGLLDDGAYAAMLVRTRRAERGLSRRAIAVELARRGLTGETGEVALSQLDDADEEATATALAGRLLGRTRAAAPEVRLRRAVGALGRKGYSPDIAYAAVRAALAAEAVTSDDIPLDAGG